MSTVGIRLHRSGSIYSRIRDLLKTDVIERDNRPLWYDVYEAFPPIREPVYVPDMKLDEFGLSIAKDDVRPILYEEDWVRATYSLHYSKVSHNNLKDVTSMFIDKKYPCVCSTLKFVEQYQEFKNKDSSKEEIFAKTLDYFGKIDLQK
ncbi:small ribosomal subunit protein mS23-like [Clavelina lepadiformis]|uniref:Small ribosomal subunit protein mS23 n=1 Tax=Clavelina lepadiformis TaxID=159417 RepID=A0ABP0EZT7_CLALP